LRRFAGLTIKNEDEMLVGVAGYGGGYLEDIMS
jgi:hypothetical protein